MNKMNLAVLALAGVLFGGCAAAEEPAKPVEKVAEQSAVQTKADNTGEALKAVVADDELSKLQLSSPCIPIYDKLTVAERRERGLATELPKLVPYEKEKVAYLTFDDGPELKNTPAVLDILKENGVKATFYLVGSYIKAYPEVVKRIYEEGHAIGNHTFSHDYDSLYSSPSAFVAELEANDEAIKSIIGVRPFIVRAPGGSMGQFDESYWQALKAAGYVEHDWNVSSADAAPNNPIAQDFIDNIDSQTAGGISTAVILMHSSAGHEETVKALPEIIRILKKRSYKFGVVTPMTPDV